MESFQQRLIKLRTEAGLTPQNLAYLLNISVNGVNALETGYIEPERGILDRICDIFNVSKSYMILATDNPQCREGNDVKEVYVLKTLGGDDGIVKMSDIAGTVFIEREQMHGKDYSGLLMNDDSMCKSRIYKNDILIVRKQTYAENGDIVVCVLEDGQELVRRYNKNGNFITLSAEGDNFKYQTIKIDTRETKFKIIGKVIEVRIINF